MYIGITVGLIGFLAIVIVIATATSEGVFEIWIPVFFICIAYGSVSLAGIDSKMIDCKHVALCTDAVKLEVFDNDELTATSYKTALFS